MHVCMSEIFDATSEIFDATSERVKFLCYE